ncbi:MAG: sulfatase-like hydrolase/transferase [Candidatus Scalindua sp.]|nr:sulfatase-like hydrolase/transferase [Candidatus Scalindua sp.]
MRLLIFILRLILLNQFEVYLERKNKNKNKNSIRLKLRRWPQSIPVEMLQNGLQYDSSRYYNKDFNISKLGKVCSFFFGKEILYGTILNRQTEYDLSYMMGHGKVTVPLCLPGKKFQDLKIVVDSRKTKLDIMECSKWQYFTFPENCKSVKISSKESKIILGEPFPHKQVPQNDSRPKCVVLLVLDSLSQSVFDKIDKETLMPNTMQYFNSGRIFTHHYAQGEWSLPNNASILTGLYTSNHCLYHPDTVLNFRNEDEVYLSTGLNNKTPLLSEVFSNEGYLTFAGNANWRVHPLYKYTRGFDRFLYYGNTTSDRELIYDATQQINAFPKRDHFLYLNLLKIHSEEYPAWTFSSEVNCDIEDRIIINEDSKLLKKYSRSMVNRYYKLIKETDDNLKILYDFLNKTYSRDEIVICLTADHGAVYLDEDEHILSETHVNIPLLVRANKIKPGTDNSLVQNIDIFPSILNLCGINIHNAEIDGKLWPVLGGNQRDYVLAESIYGSEYKLKLRGKDHIYNMDSIIKNNSISFEEARKLFWEVSKDSKYDKRKLEKRSKDFVKYDRIAEEHIKSVNNNIHKEHISAD